MRQVLSQHRHVLCTVRLSYHTVNADNSAVIRQCDNVTTLQADHQRSDRNDLSFLFSCISKHDLQAAPQGHEWSA